MKNLKRPPKNLRKAASADWGSINPRLARDRLLDNFQREQRKSDVDATLAAVLNGELRFQHLLFSAMLDSWGKLQRNIAEMCRSVVVAPWKAHAYAPRGGTPSARDEAIAKQVEEMVWNMRPNPKRMESGIEGTISNLALGYYYGHQVLGVHWEDVKGEIRPRCTVEFPARFYGYPSYYAGELDMEDRLMLDANGGRGAAEWQDFDELRFLTAINRGHASHPAIAAPLRALAPYWLAATFGLKWLMDFSQRFGIPFRHVKLGDMKNKRAVEEAMERMAQNAYAITPTSASIEFVTPPQGAQQPQRDLIELADKQADVFILGQTLTSGTDGSGSRALGDVHSETKHQMIDAVSDFVGEVLTYQLIPAIVQLNWGDSLEGMPQMWAKREEKKDLIEGANRVKIMREIGLPISKEEAYEATGFRVPSSGEEVAFEEEQEEPEPDEEEDDEEPEGDEDEEPANRIAAADAQPPTTPDVIAAKAISRLTGVSREWLGPVMPFFVRLAALAQARVVTDADFLEALEKAEAEIPELFERINTDRLAAAFEEAISPAMLSGALEESSPVRLSAKNPNYDPNQPRLPAGSEGAGRWTATGRGAGLGKGESARRGEMRPATDEERKALKIPPLYKDAMVSDDPDSDVLAIAKKPNGDDWPLYSDAYNQRQQDAKWGRIAALESEFGDLSAKMDADIEAGGRDAGPAAALRLIRETGLRNGSEGRSMVAVLDADGNPMKGPDGKALKQSITTYGASSLRGTHVTVSGDEISLDFPGKKGVRQQLTITDPVLARVMAPSAGRDEPVFGTTSARTLAYLGRISGDKYKVHDFRTLNATMTAERMVSAVASSGGRPQNNEELQAVRRRIAESVSGELGNTWSVALEKYIHPDVFPPIQP